MKKRNKKLPKYAYGYKKPIAPAAIQKDPNYISTDGDEVTWDNSKNQSRGLNAGQYAAIGTSLAGGGASLYSNLNDPNASLRQKSESLDNTTMGVAGTINPLVGGIIAGVNTIAKPIRTKAELTDENGNLVNRNKARNMSIVGGLLDPVKAFSTRASYKGGFTDWFGQGYLDNLEAEAKAKLPEAPPEVFDKDYRQDAVWQKLNNYQQYAMGGQSNNPNAEVEGDELMRYPDGSTQLMNGPSHENGGIPVNIPQGTEIFSDRLKLPGSKQTIAEEAKKYATNKEDKILSNKKSTSIAKNTAKLSSQFKQQKLDELFNAQEQLKQAKLAKYANKLGVNIPQNQFKMGGMKHYPNGGVKNITPIEAQRIAKSLSSSGLSMDEYNKLDKISKKMVDASLKIYQPNYSINDIPFTGANNSRDSVEYLNGYNKGYKMANNFPEGSQTIFEQSLDPMYGLYGKARAAGYFANPRANNRYANGGVNLPKYPNGNSTRNFLDPYKPVFNQVTYPGQPYNPYQKNLAPWSVNTSQDTNLISQPVYGENSDYTTQSPTDYTDYNSMRNRNIAEGVGNGLLQNVGNFYDLYQTNMGRKYDIEDYGSVNPRYYNPKTISATESLRDADRQAAASRYALRNAVGGNSGAYLANLAANQTANTLNKAKIRESVNNTNTNILNQADLTNTGIRNDAERYNLDLKNRAKIDTSMNKARSEDIARQAVRGIGENLSESYKDYKLGEQDQKKLALINQIFPNYKFNEKNFEFYYRSANQASKTNNRPKRKKTR